jgi:hypothetical protein
MSTEQKPIPAPITMDARNFLRAINSSAQSKVVFFENVVRRLGAEAKRNFRLVALQPANLMFEDVDTNTYYLGDIKKDGPRFTINNIKKVNVVEEKKADLFAKNCNDLVDAISESDFKSADRVFNKIELQRFRSRVIPESGRVTTRDGESRKIKIENDTVKEDRIPQIVKAFTQAVSDSVEVSDGLVVSGTFTETGEQFTLPVDEFTRRRIVARRMKQVAESAYKSPAFQKLVGNIAGLVSQKKVAEAVEVAAKFLKEEQEFCLLTQNEMKSLVDSAMASQGEFNPFLIEDVSTLMYRTNAKVNRDNILECWTKTAQKAQNANLLTQAKSLSEAKNFANDYGVFLESLFNEEGDVNGNRAKAYLVSLKVVKSVLSHIEGQEQLVSDIDKMVQGLTSGEPSTDIIYQAEELIAGISDTIIDRVQTLENYNQMPGVEDQEPLEPEADEPEGEPVPLPELGGEDEFGGDLGGEPGLDGAAAPAPAAGADLNAPQMVGAAESKNNKKALTESNFTPIEKMSTMELEEELLSWKTDGHIYLKEDGFEDCFGQLNRYIDRCNTLGANGKSLREAFEQIRDVVIEEGNDVSLDLPTDPYAGKVNLKEGAKIEVDYKPLSEDIGGLSGPSKMLTAGGDKSGMSELQKGEGVQKKGVGNADGRKGDGVGAAENYDLKGNEKGEFGRKYGQNETTMADEWQSKTKGIVAKGLKKVSGQDGSGAEGAEDYTLEGNKKGEFGRTYAQNETRMDDELQSKTTPISDKKAKATSGTHGESVVDRIAAALTEEGHYEKQTGVKHKAGGGTMDEPTGEFGRKYKEGETTMGDELQDEKDKYFGDKKKGEVCEELTPDRIAEDYAKQTGMNDSGLKDGYMKQPKGEFGRSYKEGETSMSDENQDKTDAIDDKELAEPVKEGAEKCEGCDDKDCACQKLSEDQRKGPRRHVWGRKKSAIAPREMDESKSKGKSINEEVMVYDKEAPLDEIIQAVLDSVKPDMGMGGEMGGDMPVPGMGDEVGGMGGPEGMEAGMDDMPGGMPGEEGMPGDMPPGGEGMEEVPGGAPESEMPAEGPLGTPEGDAAHEAGEEFNADNLAAGIPAEGEPGHEEMEGPEEKAAEAGAAEEAGGGEKKGNPFAKGGDDKKGPPKPPKKEKKDDGEKKEKKDDKKKEESFDRSLGDMLSSIKEEKACKCGKPNCKCCKDCGNAKCSC